MFKRIWAVLTAIIIVIASSIACYAEDKGVGFVAKASQVDSNYTFSMNIVVENLGGKEVGGLILVLRYDSRLFKVENAATKLDGAVVKDNSSNAYVNFAWENSNGKIKNNSTLFTVKFRAKKKNLTGNYTMSLACPEIYDSSENLVKIKNYTKVQDVNMSAIVKASGENNKISVGKIILYSVLILIIIAVIIGVFTVIRTNKTPKAKYNRKRGKFKND